MLGIRLGTPQHHQHLTIDALLTLSMAQSFKIYLPSPANPFLGSAWRGGSASAA
jgi:hypothetical protein